MIEAVPSTLPEAQRQFQIVSEEFREAICPEELDCLGREIRGLYRLIVWLRARGGAQ